MPNGTAAAEFLLLLFSDARELQILLFVLLLGIYLAALAGNLLILTVVALDRRLHTPMYFFLGNLALLDLGAVSVTIPKAMDNCLRDTRSVSYAGCLAQVFLVIFFASADFALLTAMAYDRYVAVCRPLHYETTMNRTVCIRVATGAWASGVLYSAMHTGGTFAISFCGGNTVEQFFCEVPQLLKLACADSSLPEVGVIVCSVCLVLVSFAFIVVSYVQIFRAALRIPSGQGQHKAFSTCLPHLAVVSLFVCSGAFAYLKPTSHSPSGLDLVVAVLYTVLPPLTNPVIYSMRNRELKAALRKRISWALHTQRKTPPMVHLE